MNSNCPVVKKLSQATTVTITLSLIVIANVPSHNGENFLNGKYTVYICGRLSFD